MKNTFTFPFAIICPFFILIKKFSSTSVNISRRDVWLSVNERERERVDNKIYTYSSTRYKDKFFCILFSACSIWWILTWFINFFLFLIKTKMLAKSHSSLTPSYNFNNQTLSPVYPAFNAHHQSTPNVAFCFNDQVYFM